MLSDQHVAFKGEVQLKAWTIKHSTGAELAFWCADEADIETLKNMTMRKGKQAGQRLMMVLVEIGDDEQPVPQPEIPADVKGGPLAQKAGMLLSDADFAAFCGEESPNTFILKFCEVKRKRDIDHLPMARTNFMRMMTQFRNWKGEV